MFKQKIFIVLVAISNIVLAQSNTSSPYSLFGLGLLNDAASGSLAALGNTGIANDNPYQVNLSNPASLGNIIQKSFLYEFGLNYSSSEIKNNETTEDVTNGNISHFAIAFPIKHNWGVGLGLQPLTKVGYDITVTDNVEGSEETFTTNTTGEGGLNKFYIATGIKLGKTLSVGLDFGVIFGSIKETTQPLLIRPEGALPIAASFFTEDETRYTGTNLRTGFQYAFYNKYKGKTTIGGFLEIPVSLNESLTRTTSVNAQIEDDLIITDLNANNFELPISSGIAITSNVYSDYTVSLDYKSFLWEATDQAEDNPGEYNNQSIYAFGLEYAPSKKKLKYLNRLKYRFGFNYNTGYINVENTEIDSYFISLGAGIPLDRNARNLMNLSYSYGQEGTTSNGLIQENIHKITLNLSFIGNWFKERKIF